MRLKNRHFVEGTAIAEYMPVMHRRDLRILTPCGADWASMTATEAKGRLCAACDKVVHDVSAMSERAAKESIGDGPACVRYLYDAHGNVFFGRPAEGTVIVPASSLLSKVAQRKWMAAAALAAVPMLLEACGGADGSARSYYVNPVQEDGGRENADPNVKDDAGSTDAGVDATDGQEDDAGDGG